MCRHHRDTVLIKRRRSLLHSSHGVVLLNPLNVKPLQLHHRFHVPLQRVKLPQPSPKKKKNHPVSKCTLPGLFSNFRQFSVVVVVIEDAVLRFRRIQPMECLPTQCIADNELEYIQRNVEIGFLSGPEEDNCHDCQVSTEDDPGGENLVELPGVRHGGWLDSVLGDGHDGAVVEDGDDEDHEGGEVVLPDECEEHEAYHDTDGDGDGVDCVVLHPLEDGPAR
ncbi:hypothetical protein G2W53_028437 [Senna tora]|uniref:Uncharacterized protein n=1 Tax=Senna tora TaxID=362788 RepID=A0A834T3D3_9FABA|nr:hypothetical protein G2W53_028437 [Senna tora]